MRYSCYTFHSSSKISIQNIEAFVGVERGISVDASPTKRIKESLVFDPLSLAVGEAIASKPRNTNCGGKKQLQLLLWV